MKRFAVILAAFAVLLSLAAPASAHSRPALPYAQGGTCPAKSFPIKVKAKSMTSGGKVVAVLSLHRTPSYKTKQGMRQAYCVSITNKTKSTTRVMAGMSYRQIVNGGSRRVSGSSEKRLAPGKSYMYARPVPSSAKVQYFGEINVGKKFVRWTS